MDFGFVRGSDWNDKTADGNTITSINGYLSYLLVVDRATRFKWVMLKASKKPPVTLLRGLLQKLQCKESQRYIMTDEGGELARSKDFETRLQKNLDIH